ncbi:MAG: tRNA threonylcarbamoyladenosine dehydratase [Lachnospiraceae bacterium]|nr:tRNA threonylcarbamoyladenosine dehydratase [Lachnospiraceae bacterium]MDO5549859.1 tRNA threonylcarbamoyladenosine dehydratase [Lachnospiraceae bacterium]
MIHEFSRTEMLIGEAGLQKLKSSHIAVFGAGGVGSHCIDALARSGVGILSILDNDDVALTNLNRQSIAFHSTIGKKKTEVFRERIADISPSCQVHTWQTFVLPENLTEIMTQMEAAAGRRPDYIIDAIDTVAAKLSLAEYAAHTGIPLIASMGTGNKLHAECFEITDIYKTSVCPLCRVMRRELKKRGIPSLKVLYSKEEPLTPALPVEDTGGRRSTPGSVSFVPPVAGLLIAGEVIRELCGLNGMD